MQPAPASSANRAIGVRIGITENFRKPGRIRTESNQHFAFRDLESSEMFAQTWSVSSALRVNNLDDWQPQCHEKHIQT